MRFSIFACAIAITAGGCAPQSEWDDPAVKSYLAEATARYQARAADPAIDDEVSWAMIEALVGAYEARPAPPGLNVLMVQGSNQYSSHAYAPPRPSINEIHQQNLQAHHDAVTRMRSTYVPGPSPIAPPPQPRQPLHCNSHVSVGQLITHCY